ncbi:MAG: NYN domain-containing protein, partial [Acidobacteriota bacterium]
SGKNSADIKMVVDAMDLCYSKEHINYFVVISGDSDFAPLVAKLKENNKTVIGVGVQSSTSNLLASNCDEFIFYDDLVKRPRRLPRTVTILPKDKQACFKLVLGAIEALEREDKEVLWGSMVKQTIKRKLPSFSEASYGYGSFSELLEDGAQLRLFGIRKDQRSGSYVVIPTGKG